MERKMCEINISIKFAEDQNEMFVKIIMHQKYFDKFVCMKSADWAKQLAWDKWENEQ